MKHTVKKIRKVVIWFLVLSVIIVIAFAVINFLLTKFTDIKLPYLEKNSKPTFIKPDNVKERGLNLVFVSDQYESKGNFLKDVDALEYEMKRIEPWKTFDDINSYKIYTNQENCQVITESERKPTLRCNEKLNNLLAGLDLGRFKVIVLSRQDFQSWANVARLSNSGIFFSIPKSITQSESTATGYLFDHLLGHAFGLKDEEKYVIAKAGGAPHTPDGPNCAPDKATAEKWWGSIAKANPENIGYFNTCAGSDSYIKPTKSSLMNLADLDNFVPNYGAVSTLYLKKFMNYCFTTDKYQYSTDTDFFNLYPELKSCVQT
jgi:hypothetical protein